MEEKRLNRDIFIFRAAWGVLIYQALALLDIFTKGVLHTFLVKSTDNSMGVIISGLLIFILPLSCFLSVYLGILLARRKADRILTTFLFVFPIVILIALGVWLAFR